MTATGKHAFLRRVQKSVGRAINRYDLIQSNDRVAVGLSGGKDSVVLLEALALRRRWIPIHYDIHAIHINVRDITPEFNEDFFNRFCSDLSISLHIRTIEIDLNRNPRKSACFVCSWHRRKEMFSAVSEFGCNRLALGHHMDDALETLFLNMTFNGSFSALPPRLSMFRGEFDIIRPLILLTEQEISRYAGIREYPVVETKCPHENDNRRAEMKRIIGDLSRMNRKAKRNIFASMSNIHDDHLVSGGSS
ncbi:MAG: tRNA 2-thiocytidine(32) synthetase TtcA [Spirochaetes bacterium]|nr:tRNA 2-thiocytidine(32) synthetase TtcA [Spirochaetota bacterium]